MSRKTIKTILIIGLVIILVLSGILIGLIIQKKKEKAEIQAQIKIQQEQEALEESINDTEVNLLIQEETPAEDISDEEAEESVETEEIEVEEEPVQKPQSVFTAVEIVPGDAVYNQIIGKSYVDNPNVALSDLRYLKLSYYDFNHEVQEGEMIVNKAIADDVINVFKELFECEYEFYSMKLIDNFWTGDPDSSDTASCDADNTSSFCYREVTGGGNLSNHAWGCAIDVNPRENPYVSYKSGEPKWSHENANNYIARNSGDPHEILEGDICYNTFIKYGFSWGGAWKSIKDYQHFEKKPF